MPEARIIHLDLRELWELEATRLKPAPRPAFLCRVQISGLLHSLLKAGFAALEFAGSCGCDPLADEGDLAFEPGPFMLDVTALDGSDRFDSAQRCFG